MSPNIGPPTTSWGHRPGLAETSACGPLPSPKLEGGDYPGGSGASRHPPRSADTGRSLSSCCVYCHPLSTFLAQQMRRKRRSHTTCSGALNLGATPQSPSVYQMPVPDEAGAERRAPWRREETRQCVFAISGSVPKQPQGWPCGPRP